MTPAAKRSAQGHAVAMSLIAVLLTVLWATVAHPARADICAGVVQAPVALGCGQRSLPFGGRSLGEIADGVIGRVLRFGGKIAACESNRQRTMGIGAGQGKASKGLGAPARYPRMRTDRGRGLSTESRALRSTLLTALTYQPQRRALSLPPGSDRRLPH